MAALRSTLAWCALLSGTAQAAGPNEIVDLINAYRAAPDRCAGRASAALPPLRASAALAKVRPGPGSFLQQELARAGYQSRQAEAIGVGGAGDPAEVMTLLRQQYCAVLRDPALTDIGVAETNGGWSIVLATEDIVPPLPAQQEAARTILAATNRARATGRHCGTQYFAAAPPLTSNTALDTAALAHSSEMAALRYFSHQGKDGSQVGDRASRAGYAWHRIGENIASGMRTPEEAVAGWVTSPGHCANLMNPSFTHLGSGFSQTPETGIVFWTQVFGLPR
jgi:uncharacterized protein YkwD